MKNILDQLPVHITQSNWINALLFLAIAFGVIWIFKILIVGRIKAWTKKTAITWDDFLIELIEKNVVPILYILTLYVTTQYLPFNQKARNIAHVTFAVLMTFFIVRIISQAVRKFIYSFIQKQEINEGKIKQANGLILIINAMVWVLGIIFLIDNLGYDVTTLIAGLGIGGIAIALAAQAILGDLFSYFVIFFDKPFEIGDFITVDDKSGNVEYIGIKTTRIRTLSGEQLICSNTDLTNARLHNYKRLDKRRIVFKLGVIYQTTLSQLEAIPGMVKTIIEQTDDVTFGRAHFSGYGDFSLDFEFVYYVNDQDYDLYMDKQQHIYLKIFKAFSEQGIEFAYPTQTLFMEKSNTA